MIIGITGTLGAGKGTVVEYLVGKKGFKHFSAREMWIEEVKKRGLPVTRDTITVTANDLRAQHGSDLFAQRAIEFAKEHGDVVAESIRSVGEAEYLKSHGATLWAVDADIHTRYERIVMRASETDKVSFDEFKAHEEREWENTDPTKQNLKAVIAMAGTKFTNDATQDELFAHVNAELAKAGI